MFFVNPKHFALLTYSGELDGNGVEDLVEKKMKQEAQKKQTNYTMKQNQQSNVF